MAKAVSLISPNVLEIRDFEVPVCDDGIIIEVLACGVCGTDGHIVDGKFNVPYPVIPGHEIYGKVVSIGSNNQVESLNGNLKINDIVAVIPGKCCGVCAYCKHIPDEEVLCPNRVTYGISLSTYEYPVLGGGYSEYVVLKKGFKVYHLPEEWPFGLGALIETVAVGVNAATKAFKYSEPVENRELTAVVLGAGAIGFFTSIGLRRRGIKVTVVEPKEERRNRMRRFKFDEVYDTKPEIDELWLNELWNKMEGLGPDIVVEAAGTLKAFNDAMKIVRRGGTIVELGNFADVGSVEVKPSEICRKQLRIIGTALAPEYTFDEAKEIINDLREFADDIILIYDLEDYDKALDNLRVHKKGLKALLVPRKEVDSNE